MRRVNRFRHEFSVLVRRATVAVLVLSLGAAGVSFAATDNGAMSVVKNVVDQAVKVLQDKNTAIAERQQKLRDLVDGSFDFEAMARTALGYHWRSISPAQRKEFTKVFTSFVEDSYLSRITDYSNQKVDFMRTRSQGAGYAEVMTRILQKGKQPVPVSYMLRKQGNKWLIYDVTVDNISIIANYRNQFNRVVNNQGFPTLLSDLKRKQKQLAASMGTSH